MPSNAQNESSLPVKAWIYGGFNKVGGTSYPPYNACNLATDAVVVEINHRVGPLGFMSLESAGIAGNMGIQDVLMALRWVQRNIGSFGGNGSQVLLFGQSAGAGNTFAIASLHEAKDLIAAAAAKSGAGQFITPLEIAQEVGGSYATALNCSKSDVSIPSTIPDRYNANQYRLGCVACMVTVSLVPRTQRNVSEYFCYSEQYSPWTVT